MTAGAGTARRAAAPVWFPVALAVALSALLGAVAADARWLAAIGGYVVRHGSIPDFVPFAAAPSHDWHNVPVLGELAFHALDAVGGDRALVVAQVVAVAVAFSLLVADARRAGADDSRTTVVLLLLIPATLAELANVRSQLFSIALFPLLLLLLRAEARPSRRIWLLVPLVVLWSNLHGGVLTGVAVAGRIPAVRPAPPGAARRGRRASLLGARRLRHARALADGGLLRRRPPQRGGPARGGAVGAALAHLWAGHRLRRLRRARSWWRRCGAGRVCGSGSRLRAWRC